MVGFERYLAEQKLCKANGKIQDPSTELSERQDSQALFRRGSLGAVVATVVKGAAAATASQRRSWRRLVWEGRGEGA